MPHVPRWISPVRDVVSLELILASPDALTATDEMACAGRSWLVGRPSYPDRGEKSARVRARVCVCVSGEHRSDSVARTDTRKPALGLVRELFVLPCMPLVGRRAVVGFPSG